jgi:hypothetical protein
LLWLGECLAGAASGSAGSADSTLCSQAQANCFARQSNSQKTAIESCKILMETSVCRELSVNPEFMGRTNLCTPQEICENSQISAMDYLSSCKLGFLEGTGEGMTKTYEDGEALFKWFAEALDKWQQPSTDTESSNNGLSRQKAAARAVESQTKENFRRAIARNSAPSSSLFEQAEKAEKVDEVRSRQNVHTQSLFAAVQEWYQARSQQLSCMNPTTRTEMICWGAAYILDPTVVAGAALKGKKAAQWVLNLSRRGGIVNAKAPTILSPSVRNEIIKNHSEPAEFAERINQIILEKNQSGADPLKISYRYMGELKPGGPNTQRGSPIPELQIFRKKTKTTLFPKGINPDDVAYEAEQELKKTNSEALKQVANYKQENASLYTIDYKGARYNVYICKMPDGCLSHGEQVSFGAVTTLHPVCGEGVVQTVTLGAARKLVETKQDLQLEDFLKSMPCGLP